jgi:hypothetical protein
MAIVVNADNSGIVYKVPNASNNLPAQQQAKRAVGRSG